MGLALYKRKENIFLLYIDNVRDDLKMVFFKPHPIYRVDIKKHDENKISVVGPIQVNNPPKGFEYKRLPGGERIFNITRNINQISQLFKNPDILKTIKSYIHEQITVFIKNIIKEEIRHLFEDYYDEHTDITIPSIGINRTAYHGTAFDSEEDNVFDEFDTNYSDFEATWFSEEEYIAEEFSENRTAPGYIKAVYMVKLKSDNLADFSLSIFEELKNFYEYKDAREYIKLLKNAGFDGWITLGSIGYHQYDDIAIFNDNVIEIVGIKLLINEEWTDYMSLNEANEIIKNIS